jgi:hypothetical protein
MTSFDESFEDRAQKEIHRAAFSAIARHTAPALVVPLLGAVIAVAAWPLAIVGALQLTMPWEPLAVGLLVAAPVRWLWFFSKYPARRRAERAKDSATQREEVRQQAQDVLEQEGRWRNSITKLWPQWLIFAVPKGALAAVAADLWWPTWAAVLVCAVVVAMPPFSVWVDTRSKRLSRLAGMFAEGEKRTPEI